MARIKEERPSRQIFWMVDMVGNTGKSTFADFLDLSYDLDVLLLTIDHYRSFKHTMASDIENFIKEKGREPAAFIVDAPRDEETKFLHEIYGALEELKNGRLFSVWGNQRIRKRIRREKPIFVFSNSPPTVAAMSSDRWDIKALTYSHGTKDVICLDARVEANVNSWSNTTVTYQNVTETISYDALSEADHLLAQDYESDMILFEMYTTNYLAMYKESKEQENKMIKERLKIPGQDLIVPGVIKKWDRRRTVRLNNAPENILAKYEKKVAQNQKSVL